ncbi:MAG: RNA polymerase sigma factor [Thermoleophilia bacterium]|nr:RNA polymerase sigma factor [Thermoleophilia bacterium]
MSAEDPACFTVVYRRHVEAIYRYVSMRVGSVAAEDITADVFETAFDKRAGFRPGLRDARPWFYGIAARQLLKHRAAEARWLEGAHRMRSDSPVEDDRGNSEARIDAQLSNGALRIALALLPPGERDVVLLHAVSDLTHDEIARALGIRTGTAKTRLSRGTARLRNLLPTNFKANLDGEHDHAG